MKYNLNSSLSSNVTSKVKRLQHFVGVLFLLAGVMTVSQSVFAGSNINFNSDISAINETDTDTGTVTVSIYGFDVDVVINPGTYIESNGEQIGIEDLSIADIVRIEAFFSDEGITAESISVLDARHEQFRVRGLTSGVTTLDDITTLTVLGIDINADEDTRITRRGSGRGNRVPASELEAGQEVNVSGGMVDGFLYAVRIHVGSRPTGDIEVAGTITEIVETEDEVASIVVDLGDGAIATVLIDDDTVIGGDLAVGAFVEVEGLLDELLNVLALSIIVDGDGDGDADDDHRRGPKKDKSNNGNGNGNGNCNGNGNGNGNCNGNGNDDDDDEDNYIEVSSSIALTPEAGESSGSAKYRYESDDDDISQRVEITVDGADASEIYNIAVFFGATEVNFGDLETDDQGDAAKDFDTDPDVDEGDLAPLLPAGMDVRDITAVEISLAGEVILDGEF